MTEEHTSLIGNGCVARDWPWRQGARRKNILHGSLTDEQHRRRGPRSATLWAKTWRAKGGVAPQSQNALAMLLRCAWPSARQTFAQPFPIYEMGSKSTGNAAPCPTSAMRAQQMATVRRARTLRREAVS